MRDVRLFKTSRTAWWIKKPKMQNVAQQPQQSILPPESDRLFPRDFPQVIKYMGSKARIIDFVVEGIREAYRGGPVCDLFAGACPLSGAIGHLVPIVSNDIQTYSKVIAHSYLHRLSASAQKITGKEIITDAQEIVDRAKKQLPSGLTCLVTPSLTEFNEIEARNRELIENQFDGDYHLFVKFYSGTWWSAEQCLWIDALREVADRYIKEERIRAKDHCIFLTCIMHAMAYCGQGTGHYAQYRDAKTKSSLEDINRYRQKSVAKHFSRKFNSLKAWNIQNVSKISNHKFRTLDYVECLEELTGGTVYADPPYAFVHYSRFYHAIETLVLYDYPELQIKGGKLVKGRYREGRHQSPFSIRSLVPQAFEKMFIGISDRESNLVLSYSNSGLFALEELFELGHDSLGKRYNISVLNTDHTHMTMGRKKDRDRDVEEALLIAVKR